MTISLTVQVREETKAGWGHTARGEHDRPQQGGQFQF